MENVNVLFFNLAFYKQASFFTNWQKFTNRLWHIHGLMPNLFYLKVTLLDDKTEKVVPQTYLCFFKQKIGMKLNQISSMYFLAGNSKSKLPFLARPHYIASIPISNFKVCIVWFVIVSLITGLSEVQIGIFTFNSWTLLRTHFDIWLTTWVYTWPTLPHYSQSFFEV